MFLFRPASHLNQTRAIYSPPLICAYLLFTQVSKVLKLYKFELFISAFFCCFCLIIPSLTLFKVDSVKVTAVGIRLG